MDTETTPSPPKRLKTAEESPPLFKETLPACTQPLTVIAQQGLENHSAEEFMKMLFEEEGRTGNSSCDFMFDEALEL